MTILGINAYHGDAAAAIVRNGRIVAAAAEERFSRVKHEGGVPRRAIEWCVREANGPIDAIAIGRNPRLHSARKALALLRFPGLLRHGAERRSAHTGLRTLAADLGRMIPGAPMVHWIEHHLAHLTCAYVTSPFDRCAVLSLDGFGDFVSAAWGKAAKGSVRIKRRIFFPHSLGIFYTALTQFLGFSQYGEEYKVMALAAYGSPRYRRELQQMIRLTPTGFSLNHRFFEHVRQGVPMSCGSGMPVIGRVFHPILSTMLGAPRTRDEPLTDRHADIAASLQSVTEDVVLHVARLVKTATGESRIALAGGVALNSVANGVLLRSGIFDEVWIPSAPADDGTAIGAAASVAHGAGEWREPSTDSGSPYLGPLPGPVIVAGSASMELRAQEHLLIDTATELLAGGAVIGWCRGRMEFGPRALGHRSILADPRDHGVRDRVNALIKKRELFRPLAPMVLLEDASIYFDLHHPSPTMMFVASVRPMWRSRLPAITHVDGSARIQTVDRRQEPELAALLDAWKHRTGISVLLNTSFNEREPMVATAADAVACFLRTPLDALVINDTLYRRAAADGSLREEFQQLTTIAGARARSPHP